MKFSVLFELQLADGTPAEEVQTFHEAVEQAVAAETQPRNQMDQGDFASVGLAAEHAFAKESRTDRDPV